MKLASFRTGLHLTLNDAHYRIEKIINLDRCYLERLSDGALEVKTKKELALYHANGDLSLHGSAPISNENKRRNALDINGVSAEKQKEILRRFEYVKESNALLGETPTKINMDEVVRRVVIRIEDSNPPCIYTVYRWWKLWLNSGKDLMSLAKKKSGKSGSRRFKGVIETELHKVIEDMYLTKQKNSKKQVFDEFCNRINQLNKIRETPLKNFSRSTFYREIDKIDKYDVLCAREGKRVADQHFRVTGAGVRTNYILERVEVDHTPLDVIILNEHTGLADGRPTLTMLIDHYSRIPLGFEIGFEVPSELSVMRAIRNSILSKAYIKESFPEIQNDWPAFGIPNTLICDNGLEFHSGQLQRMCTELNIAIQYCPKQEPNYKGTIERYIRSVNESVSHRIPGTTFSNVEMRGDYDSEEEVRITLRDLKRLLHMWVVDIYNQQIHSITHRTPVGLWNEGLKVVEPILPESLSQLNLILTRELKRTLTHKGIEVSGLFYNSSDMAVLRRRCYESYEVTIRIDPEDIGNIWVYDDINTDYIFIPCTTPEYACGVTARQHKEIRQYTKEKGKMECDENSLLESKARFTKKINDLSQNKLMRERKKAARLNPSNVGNNIFPNDEKYIYSSNFFNKKTKEINADNWIFDEIPVFKTTEKGGV